MEKNFPPNSRAGDRNKKVALMSGTNTDPPQGSSKRGRPAGVGINGNTIEPQSYRLVGDEDSRDNEKFG